MTTNILKVENLGKLILLGDGSTWAVGMVDAIKSMLWFPGDRIEIDFNKLINIRRKESVSAQRE